MDALTQRLAELLEPLQPLSLELHAELATVSERSPEFLEACLVLLEGGHGDS